MTEEKKKKKESGGISRRDFLKDAGLLVGGAAIGSTVLLAACGGKETTTTATKTVTSTAPGGTVTSTVPGATVTTTAGAVTQTVTAPGGTVTTTAPGGTVTEEVSRFVCPLCGQEFDTIGDLQAHFEAEHPAEAVEQIFGRKIYELPSKSAEAVILHDPVKCVGCMLCTYACSMKHFGIISKDASNMQVRQPQIPYAKGIPVNCAQCEPWESLCTAACPTTPESIYYDTDTKHMVINKDTCLGQGCLACVNACTAKAVRFNAAVSNKPFVCDLCDVDNTGNRDPECVKACYSEALFFHTVPRGQTRYWYRRSIMEKADMIAKQIYPLTKESLFFPVRNWEE